MTQKCIDLELLYETLLSSLHEHVNTRKPVPPSLVRAIKLISRMGMPVELVARLEGILDELPVKKEP